MNIAVKNLSQKPSILAIVRIHATTAHYKLLKRQEKINNFNVEQSKPVDTLLPFNTVIQQKEFLNIEETAALIGASRRTLFRLISNGTLKVGKIGRRTIIQRNEIDKLFK